MVKAGVVGCGWLALQVNEPQMEMNLYVFWSFLMSYVTEINYLQQHKYLQLLFEKQINFFHQEYVDPNQGSGFHDYTHT